MKYNLIFEGCDCVGKTSIIAELIKQLNYNQVIKQNAPKSKSHAFDIYNQLIKKLNNNYGLILDRGMLGEEVYSPILRNYSVDYMRDMEAQLKDHNVLILVTANIDKIIERFDGDTIKTTQINEINNKYLDLFPNTLYKHKLIIDSSNKTPEILAQEIITWINENL